MSGAVSGYFGPDYLYLPVTIYSALICQISGPDICRFTHSCCKPGKFPLRVSVEVVSRRHEVQPARRRSISAHGAEAERGGDD